MFMPALILKATLCLCVRLLDTQPWWEPRFESLVLRDVPSRNISSSSPPIRASPNRNSCSLISSLRRGAAAQSPDLRSVFRECWGAASPGRRALGRNRNARRSASVFFLKCWPSYRFDFNSQKAFLYWKRDLRWNDIGLFVCIKE